MNQEFKNIARQLKILIVEDEILTAKSLSNDLKKLGVETLDPIPKGETAVEIALKEKPDLILMDIRLAGKMDGIEAARIIKEKAKIPILFMTGYATDHIKVKTQGVDCIEFLEKPITVSQLRPIIEDFLGF